MSKRSGVARVCFVLFVYRVRGPLGKWKHLMEMQKGERCLKVCKRGRCGLGRGGVLWQLRLRGEQISQRIKTAQSSSSVWSTGVCGRSHAEREKHKVRENHDRMRVFVCLCVCVIQRLPMRPCTWAFTPINIMPMNVEPITNSVLSHRHFITNARITYITT